MSRAALATPIVLGLLVCAGAGAGAALGSCSVDRPSESLKCSVQTDCTGGRVCEQGYCVFDPNVKLDAAIDAKQIDAAVCPGACASCNFNTTTCTIDAGGGAIVCPNGWNCNINCSAANACTSVSCQQGLSCAIHCTAGSACGAIACGTRSCTVDCSGGANACGNIGCTTGNCTATCTGASACGNLSCTAGECKETCSGGSAACGTLTCGTGKCTASCTGAGPSCGAVSCPNSCQCDVMCNGTECPASMSCPDKAPGADYCTSDGLNGSRCDSAFAPNQCRSC